MTEITIPSSVTSIGKSSFEGCGGKANINCKIPNNNTGKFYKAKFTEVVIGNSVTSIGSCTFEDCTSLKSVTIGNSVTKIEYNAFGGCTGELIINSKIVETNYTYDNYPANSNNGWLYNAKFTKVTIGNSVTSIGSYAFYGCTSLTSITIPESVTEIGVFTFNSCSSLKEVYCKPTTPPTIFEYSWAWCAFDDNASGRKIYVPRNSVEAYKTAQYWSEYADYIEGYDF
jgi:hypothetical protein